MQQLIVLIVVGLIAGWLAGVIRKGRGFGVVGNLVVGVVGAAIGGLLLPIFGLHAVGVVGGILSATVGAVVLLWIVELINRSTRRRA